MLLPLLLPLKTPLFPLPLLEDADAAADFSFRCRPYCRPNCCRHGLPLLLMPLLLIVQLLPLAACSHSCRPFATAAPTAAAAAAAAATVMLLRLLLLLLLLLLLPLFLPPPPLSPLFLPLHPPLPLRLKVLILPPSTEAVFR